MSLIDVVSWDAMPGVYAWKFPETNLSTCTQLIVRESQEAVLFKDGQAVGPFTAGRHVLSSNNYPVLKELFSIPFGKSPFFAEVWFVRKTFQLDIKWGTTDPILVEDPEYHIILPVRAFGQYGITVEDATKFLIKMVGSVPAFTQKTLVSYFKGMLVMGIKDLIAKYLVEKSVSVLKISAYLNEIAEFFEEHLAEKFEEYGLKFVNFTIHSISTDETDPAVQKLKDAMASRAEMQILGYDYRTKRSFDTLDAAAANQGNMGGVMGTGMGLGMGVGMGNAMGNVMGAVAQNLSIEQKQKCSKCGTENSMGNKFCAGCGAPLGARENNTVQCPACNALIPAGVKFCPECGSRMAMVCVCGKEIAPGMKFCPACGKKAN